MRNEDDQILPLAEAADSPNNSAQNISDSPSPTVQPLETSNSDDSDIYGVREPEERVYPSSSAQMNKTGSESQETDRPDGGVSLDSIYSRRQAQDHQNDRKDDFIIPEAPKFPIYPFRTKIFAPFFASSFILQFLVLWGAAWIIFCPAFYLFNHLVRRDAQKAEVVSAASIAEELKKNDESAPLEKETASITARLLFGPKGERAFVQEGYILALALLLWGAIATSFFLQVFQGTASGDDLLAEWSSWGGMASLGQFAWLALLFFFAGIPGYAALSWLGFSVCGFLLSAILLFPVFFLSSTETDSLFNFLSRNIGRSFRIAPSIWRNFYALILLWDAAALLVLALAFRFILWADKPIRFAPLIVSLLAALIVSLTKAIYFRYLGRLAWATQEATDRYLQKKEEEAEEAENQTKDDSDKKES